MYKITDIQTLGTEYTVADPAGNIITTIQIIPFTDLLSVTMGPYTEEMGDYTAYLEKCVAVLSGFEEIDPYKVLWYATSEDEVVLSEVIEYAIKNDYDKIILEHLEELE